MCSPGSTLLLRYLTPLVSTPSSLAPLNPASSRTSPGKVWGGRPLPWARPRAEWAGQQAGPVPTSPINCAGRAPGLCSSARRPPSALRRLALPDRPLPAPRHGSTEGAGVPLRGAAPHPLPAASPGSGRVPGNPHPRGEWGGPREAPMSPAPTIPNPSFHWRAVAFQDSPTPLPTLIPLQSALPPHPPAFNPSVTAVTPQ